MTYLTDLKDAEKKLTRRYQKVQTAYTHETIGTAVYELAKCVETTPFLKQIAESLLAKVDESVVDDWLKSKGWLRPPVQRDQKARICYHYLVNWYSQMDNENFDFDGTLTHIGMRIAVSGGFDVYARAFVENLVDPFVEYLDEELEVLTADEKVKDELVAEPNPDNRRNVFVVHGKDKKALQKVTDYLTEVGLEPLTFEEAKERVGTSSPTIMEVVDKGMAEAQAVLILLTSDDEVRLKDAGEELTGQARPNVIFEAGIAFGRYRKRTVLVEYEEPSMFSDLHGFYVVRLKDADGGLDGLDDLRKQLKVAGCELE